ncbi:MAG: DUF4270 domain-containing protein [Tannerellaceae bacterium]|jgi:hypothetical protein|nr:DUF4270 domain-containing protein [Tannerellaceae bacterium]
MKSLVHLYILVAACLLVACNEAGYVGAIIQPESDKAVVYNDTFLLEASTVALDSVYAKAYYGLLGDFSDPMFGALKADFFCQFYAQEGFAFRHTPVDGVIDSIDLVLFYERGQWIGDSLATMEATVYPLVKQLEGNFYTNYNPEGHADINKPLGRISYTPRDFTVSDSLWSLSGTSIYNTHLRIRLPNALGQAFYDETLSNPASFANQQSFNKFFPGLYVTNTFGSGNILVVTDSRLLLYYRYQAVSSSTGADTIYNSAEAFYVTEDVIQLNRFRNTNISHLLEPNDEYTYIKTPAGVFTRISIPTKEIFSTIKGRGRQINDAYFAISAMPQQDWKYALAPPAYLMIIPEDSLQHFFRDNRVDNSVTTFASSPQSSATSISTYTFGNISNMLSYYLETQPELERLNLLVIPIERSLQTDSYGTPSNVSASVNNYLRPSTLRLRKDQGTMQLSVITNRYSIQ